MVCRPFAYVVADNSSRWCSTFRTLRFFGQSEKKKEKRNLAAHDVSVADAAAMAARLLQNARMPQ